MSPEHIKSKLVLEMNVVFALVIDIKQFIYYIACHDHQEFDPITRNSFYEPIGFIVTLCNPL